MKFGFVAEHRGARPVAMLYEALGMSRCGYCGSLTGPPSQHSRDEQQAVQSERRHLLWPELTL